MYLNEIQYKNQMDLDYKVEVIFYFVTFLQLGTMVVYLQILIVSFLEYRIVASTKICYYSENQIFYSLE